MHAGVQPRPVLARVPLKKVGQSSSNVKSFPSHVGPWGGTDLCFYSSQRVTGLCCETADTGLVHRVVCPFTPQFLPVPSYRAW